MPPGTKRLVVVARVLFAGAFFCVAGTFVAAGWAIVRD